MNLRLALYTLAGQHKLPGPTVAQLERVAGLTGEPEPVARVLPLGAALVGAGLGGFGVILWVAANWSDFGRTGRFALLQLLVLAACAGAWGRPAARAPLGLVALLGIGALFAFFGQTYQTGADAWQLFALWAVLALPLGLGVRSDVVWVPWVLVVMTGLGLWTSTQLDHRWFKAGNDALGVCMLVWTVSGLLTLAARAFPRFTGAGLWSVRTATTFLVFNVGVAAFGALFNHGLSMLYPAGLLLLAAAAVVLVKPRFFDVYALSLVALALNVLITGGLARLLFSALKNWNDGGLILALLVLGLVPAGMLGLSVRAILKLSREHKVMEAQAVEGAAA
ncbi:MAG: hypothetical protein RLZZ618_1347 [Pseudomonadota bacterium]|jgi:uncharacterized membrane protein